MCEQPNALRLACLAMRKKPDRSVHMRGSTGNPDQQWIGISDEAWQPSHSHTLPKRREMRPRIGRPERNFAHRNLDLSAPIRDAVELDSPRAARRPPSPNPHALRPRSSERHPNQSSIWHLPPCAWGFGLGQVANVAQPVRRRAVGLRSSEAVSADENLASPRFSLRLGNDPSTERHEIRVLLKAPARVLENGRACQTGDRGR